MSATIKPLQQFKVLTFDVVGTLIDFERGMLNYLHQTLPETPVGDEDFLASYRRARTCPDTLPYPDDLERCWHFIAAELKLPDSPELARGFRDSVPQWPAFPDSTEALRRLRQRFRLVAMTNARRWALEHFERTLGMPFDDGVTRDDALCEKPDPTFFAFARGRLSTLGYAQADNLHVAQSQYHDIGIAKQLGLTTCWIERRHAQKGSGGTLEVSQITQPDHHFHTLAQLADAVDAGH